MNDQVATAQATETPAPTTTSTSSTTPPMANTPEARTDQGEIKNQAAAPSTPSTTDGPQEPAAKAPDAYTDFKVPDGYQLDTELLKTVTPKFKELGLTQEQAQKLVDTYSEQQIALHKKMTDSVTQMRAEWRTNTNKDPVIGPKIDSVIADVNKAVTTLASGDAKLVDDFKSAMDLTGAGDHPAVIKMLHKMAGAVNEGRHVSGNGPSPHGQVSTGKVERPSAAHALYPKLN